MQLPATPSFDRQAEQQNQPSPRQPVLLVFTQVFLPDPASVGQHIGDVALELAARGRRVRVYAANRGFDDPGVVYPARENMAGVDVRRLRCSSFGKQSLWRRALGTLSLVTQLFFVGLFTRRLEGIFFSTSPPFVGLAAAILSVVRRVPIIYWAMDLNPDQVIAMGKLRPRSFMACLLERINRFILRRSKLIFTLDRFMAARIMQRGVPAEKLRIIPPWPHEDQLEPIARAENPFAVKHGLVEPFVVMYSGNHSPANPLRTLLNATRHFRDDNGIRFLFVGGGQGKKEVDALIAAEQPANVVSLPYQPLADIKFSLSAADVHVVSLGENMVGIVHPCKIYGAMAVGRPILFLGPAPSHVSDILEVHPIGWHVMHGDVPAAIAAIEAARNLPRQQLAEMGTCAQRVLAAQLSQRVLSAQFCDDVEKALV